MSETADVIVIGAGIIGCSIALEMARAGNKVLTIDKGPAAGSGSTSSSSACIRFNYSTLDGVIASWEAMHLWKDWESFLGGSDDAGLATFRRIGVLNIEPPGTRTARVTALFDKVGVPYQHLTASELAARFPAVDTGQYFPPKQLTDPTFWEDAPDSVTAVFTPDGGFVDDPQLAAHNLMDAAMRQGATFRFRSLVSEVLRSDRAVQGVRLATGEMISGPVVINASGPYSARLNAMAGVADDFTTIATRPLRQEVHAVAAPADFSLDEGGAVVMDADLGTYFRPQPGGSMIVGGTEPECDPLVWIDDPDDYQAVATAETFEAQVLRVARRLPALNVPGRPTGLAALYDVTPDWVPVYDRTSLAGFFVAIGTSGNQFKNAPLVGPLMRTVIEAGPDHDRTPARHRCDVTGLEIDLGHYSRLRTLSETSNSVLG